jgi:hypothetical protein
MKQADHLGGFFQGNNWFISWNVNVDQNTSSQRKNTYLGHRWSAWPTNPQGQATLVSPHCRQ